MESNAAGADLDPDEVSIRPQAIFASGGTGTSNTITVKGVTDIVTVTISPSSGTADIIKGGVSVGAMTTTAGLNETIAFTMTAPTTLGTKNTATITIGPDTYTWWVGYADAAKEAKVFVTSGSTSTNFGGISGADSICNSYAASSSKGLSSAWVAMISDSANSMSARIPWNWGTLKTLSGTVVVDGGYSDLLDGTFDTPINVNENGITATTYVFTGTNAYGDKYSPSGTTSYNWAYDWTNAGCVGWFASIGLSTSTTAGLYYGGDGCNNRALYCIENIDSTVLDTTPVFNGLTYPVQVATGSRQTSNTWTVSGMSTGATTTLSVTATGGTPTFTINGGAEVTSGVIRNGDSIVFKMDAPATGNTSNRMTIKVNSGADTIGYWRVWTGDTTGTVVKRIFVTPTTGNSTDTGGVSGVDAQCQSRASAASLGGTWKALVSGYGNSESEWAVNRIGYNWSKLQRIDGADVVYAGNIWNSTVTPLINPVTIRETGATLSTSYVRTGTTVNGMAAVQTANGQCNGFTLNNTYSATYALYNGTSGTTGSGWINNGNYNADQGYGTCHYYYFGHLYCIEQ